MAWGQTQAGQNAQNQFLGGYASPPQQTGFQTYLNQGLAYNAPSFAQIQLGQNQNLRNIAYGNAGYGLDTGNAALDYQSQSRDLATQMLQNGIDLAAAQRQPALIDQLLGLDNQDFGLQQKDIDVSKADAGLNAKENLQNLLSEATARGAMITQGRKDKQANIYDALVNQMGHLNISSDRIGVSQQKNTLNAAEQKAQANDRIQALQLTANRLGMKPDELKAQLDNTLAKLGLNHALSTEDLLDGIASGDLQSKQLLFNIISQAGQYAVASRK